MTITHRSSDRTLDDEQPSSDRTDARSHESREVAV